MLLILPRRSDYWIWDCFSLLYSGKGLRLPKVVGYCCLHYGLPYLEWSIRSVIDHVDEFYCLYSPHGSHNGNPGILPPIDSEADLLAAAHRGAGNKLVWVKGEWTHEGQQRDSINQYAPDADVILVVDSDEVWGEGVAYGILHSPSFLSLDVREWRIPIIHYWRSFYKCVLHDPAFPIRVIVPKRSGNSATYEPYPNDGYTFAINHFGYALPPEYIAYKWGGIHGHQAELRRDVDWFADKFMANAQTDCHPVGSEYWNPERIDPMDYMPRFMMQHPYFFKQVIE